MFIFACVISRESLDIVSVYESRRGLSHAGVGQVATPLCVVDECDGATEAIAFDDAEVVLGPGEVRDVAQVVWLDVLEVLDAFDSEFVAEQGHAM